MKITTKQRAALEWLAKAGPWTTPWWGGRPHGTWPKEMQASTFYSLHSRKLVEIKNGTWADRHVIITDAGKASIQ